MREEILTTKEKKYVPNAIIFRENEIVSETCDVYRLSLTDEQVLRLLKKMHYPLKHEVTEEEIKESKDSFYLFKGKKEFFELLKQAEEDKIQIFCEEDCGMPQLSNISDWIEMLDDYIHNSFDFAGTGRYYGRRICDSPNLRNHIWYIENSEDIFGKK
jgi:hypothetical protein